MKKSALVALLFASFVLSVGFVSAALADNVGNFLSAATDVIKTIANAFTPLFTWLFGSENLAVGASGGDFDGSGVVANLIIFLIVYIIVFLVLDSIDFFSASRWSVYVLAIGVSILSVRFLSDGMINAIIFPYKALGIALSAGLPFLLYFYAVETKITNIFGRKVAWIFLGVIYAFLYLLRLDSPEVSAFAWIYLVTALLCFLMIVLDGTFAGLRVKIALGRVGKENKEDAIVHYKTKIAGLPELVRTGIYTEAEADRKKKEYIKQIKYFESR